MSGPKAPLDHQREAIARDEALDRLRRARAKQIATAREIAEEIADRQGAVTSTEVFDAMALRHLLDRSLDARWMGAVFNGKHWRLIRYDRTGSHGRPVAVWERR